MNRLNQLLRPDMTMKGFFSMTPLLSTPSLRNSRTAHSSSGVRRALAVSPTDAARHLKFIVQQEFKSGCQDNSGFSVKLRELIEASEIQLSPISLQTVKDYSNRNLHDRQVVLQALLHQRLSAVLACPPDVQNSSVQKPHESDLVHAHPPQHRITGQGSPVDGKVETVDGRNGTKEDRKHAVGGSNPQAYQGGAISRTWASAWQDARPKRWMGAASSSTSHDWPAEPDSTRCNGAGVQHPREHVKNATDSSSQLSASTQGARSPAQQQFSPPGVQHSAGGLDRSAICAHPLPSSTPAPVPSTQPIGTPINSGAVTAAQLKANHQGVEGTVLQPSDTLTSNPTEVPREHGTHASVQTSHMLHPVSSTPNYDGDECRKVSLIDTGKWNPDAAAAAQKRAAVPEVVQHTPIEAAASVASRVLRGSESKECSESVLMEATIPFSDESRPWYCTQLFGPGQDNSEHVLLTASPADKSYPIPGRELLRVTLPGSSLFNYCLPSLLPSECEYITAVEKRIKAALYDTTRVVPIFWDTESTGTNSVEFWDGPTARIVQLAAVTDSKHGDLVFQRDINAFPVEMSRSAAEITGLETEKVWASTTCPQVGVAEFLDFCLRASEANGNALPMLVAHNNVFDHGMLLTASWQAGIQVPKCWLTLCTLVLARQVKAARPAMGIDRCSLGTLAAQFGSSVAQDELHDALEDTKQIPIITEAFERLAGPEYSLAELATPKPGVKYRATPVDAVVRKRHVQLQEKVVKRRASDPTVLATKSTANGHSSFDASEKTSTSKTKSNAAAQQQKSHVDPVRASAQHPDRTASHGNEAVRDKGTPHEPSAKLSKVSSLESDSTGAESYSQDSSSLDATSDEAPHGVLADNMSLNNQRLEYMLSSHTRDDDDPFLSAWPKGIEDSGRVEVLSGNMFDQEGLQDTWSPFTKPLQDAGLPRRTFRAPLLAKLNAAGFSNVLDLMRYTPRHEKKDYPSIHIEDLSGKVSVHGSIVSVGHPLNLLSDDGVVVERPFDASIFTGPGFKGTFKLEKDAQRLLGAEEADALVAMVGRFKEDKRNRGNKDGYTFTVTEFDVVDDRALQAMDNAPEDEQALAVYPNRRGITHADFARYIPQVLSYVKDALPEVEGEVGDNEVPPGDFLPQWVLKEQELMPWLEALSVLHAGLGSGHPAAVRKKARRRMVFNECLLLSLMMLHHRIAAQLSDSSSLAPVVCKSKTRVESAAAALPYSLTNAQQRVLSEILQDMEAPVPMLRLLQGDVGSGKTAVIFLAALAAISSGHQVAILVPNDVLATQHETFISKVSSNMPDEHQPVVEVLAGRVGVKRRREVRERLAAGEVDIIIGTTALNNPQEIFSSLGLVVIDEQHRFGVKQRANLVKKNPDAPAPHVLFATATPIPRTVAMTHMSHMTTSVIDELPPGRVPVETSIVKVKTGSDVTDGSPARQQVLERVQEELEQGGSVFWVFPLVDESEHFQDMGSAYKASELLQAQGGLIAEQTVVITGRMSSEAKAVALDAFRAGHCRLLVSTVVIEVGIDVPAATLMVVEHAERFGLLQLHQLRGRVGRSDKPSSCLLVTSSKGAMPRLNVLEQFSQGRAVAEQDLVLRGAGQLFGQRQSGPADMGLGALLLATDLAADEDVVANAREVAAELTKNYGFKDLPPPLLAALSGYNMTSLLALKMQDVDIHM